MLSLAHPQTLLWLWPALHYEHIFPNQATFHILRTPKPLLQILANGGQPLTELFPEGSVDGQRFLAVIYGQMNHLPVSWARVEHHHLLAEICEGYSGDVGVEFVAGEPPWGATGPRSEGFSQPRCDLGFDNPGIMVRGADSVKNE